MNIDVNVEISNRHVHLTEENYYKLFDEPLSVKANLSQKGEFVTNNLVTLEVNNLEIPNVRIIGPFRKYNQVEISRKDALKLNVNPPVRESGNLDGALDVTIKTEKGKITVPALILAKAHVHMNNEDAQKYGVQNNEKLQLKINGQRSGIIDVYTKISENGVFCVHIDTDEAAAFLINNNEKHTLILK